MVPKKLSCLVTRAERQNQYDGHLMALALNLVKDRITKTSKRSMRTLLVILALSPSLWAQSPDARSAQTAVERALPLLQRSAAEFVSQRSCFSCHHNALPILTLHMARDRGLRIDPAILSAVEDTSFGDLRATNALDQAIQASTLSDPTPNDSYLLMAAAAAGIERNLTMAVRVQQLLGWQQDGHWVTSDFRPPHSSSVFTATATAVRAIDLYATADLRLDAERAIDAARKWLRATRPISTEDAAFRLMGLVWSGASEREVIAARADLVMFQESTGGWAQLRGYTPDAYSTGESLFALRESGMASDEAARQRGMKFLLSTQAADGTWHVSTRMLSPAEVSPPYFATGFPYGKDEFLSYAGTCWAVMAILRSMPEPKPALLPAAENSEPWIRTALFGTSRELLELLNNGLSANSKTTNGTTLLMMAAPNAEKVRVLLSHGADVKARTASGNDALTIAAAYRGTAPSIRALLDAGADVEPPDGTRVRRSPLVFAAMTGDLSNVKLLLKHGADASANAPIAEAITFGHADVVRALIRDGADTALTERSGVNLLHWATITGRSSVIPLLVKAGVPVNDKDNAGFTPLMYAATIDFGDTAALRALLDVGADPNVRNADGRTAIEQARYLSHSAIESALVRHR
jgi:ankyrin repeat protein